MPLGTILRDYTLEAVLGHGGFGIVYRARHNLLAHRVAIKEYLPSELAVREGESVHPRSPNFAEYLEDGRRRFQEEAQALIKFRHHPSIVTCMEFFESNGTAYLVMEYEDGLPLSEVLRKRELEGRPFTEADLLEIAVPLLEGLQKVHQAGVVHRDIKPANIFVRHRDHTPVLIDFGAAKQEVAAHSKSMAPYTPGYAAFEQVGEGPLGPWTDIYAVGAVLWRMVAGGNLPTHGLNPVKVESRMVAKMRQQDDPLPSASQLGAGRFSVGVLRAIDQCLELLDDKRVRDCNALLGILLAKDKSRTSGFPDKQTNLGQIHGGREGITTDTLRAIDWYRAADQGDVDAQYRFGRLSALGAGVSQSHSEATKWFRKAADRGHAEAQFALGDSCAKGIGMPAAPAEAVRWYLKAADQGHAEAQFALGDCYAKGIGMPVDSAEAIRWYRKAAGQGHAEAQFALGHCCAKGIGMPTDSAEAVQWYRKAADQGHPKAQFALGHCYAKGIGMPADSAEAVHWYRKAAVGARVPGAGPSRRGSG